VVICGCSRKFAATEAAIQVLNDSGLSLSEPQSELSSIYKMMEKRGTSMGDKIRNIRVLESPNKVIVSFYEFDSPETATEVKIKLDALNQLSQLPERFREVAGGEDIIQKDCLVINLRYTNKASREEKDRIVEVITSE